MTMTRRTRAKNFLCLVVYLFHYKDRSKFFLICALKIFFDFDFLVETERTRETRENTLSHNSRFIFLFFFEDLAAEGDTSVKSLFQKFVKFLKLMRARGGKLSHALKYSNALSSSYYYEAISLAYPHTEMTLSFR